MWKITNTANDRTKVDLHRNAGRFDPEPSIGGHRLRLGASMEVDDNHYEIIKDYLAPMIRDGIAIAEFSDVDTIIPDGLKTTLIDPEDINDELTMSKPGVESNIPTGELPLLTSLDDPPQETTPVGDTSNLPPLPPERKGPGRPKKV